MKQEYLDKLAAWFEVYVESYYSDDERANSHYRLKYDHTHRVCTEMRYLTDHLKLNESDHCIAESIALLHDVGRFEQFRIYDTFLDAQSENHCKLALTMLQKHDVLNAIPLDDVKIIKSAIAVHGAKHLPSAIPPRNRFFAGMIRDADKIDIYYVVFTSYKAYCADPESFLLDVPFSDDPGYSREVVDAVMTGRHIDYSKIQTLNEMKLLHLGWVYDMNFAVSLQRIQELGYIDKLFSILPRDETMNMIKDHLVSYVQHRIDGQINLQDHP